MAHSRGPLGLRLSTLVIGAVLGLVAIMLPAFGDTPESGPDPRVTLTVVPDLLSGPTSNVTVTGSGFPPNTAGVLRQCIANLSECDETLVVAFTTTSSGNIPPTTVTVKRVVDPAGPSSFNCGIEVCALVARAGNAVSQHQIRFAGAGTVTVPSTSTSSTSTSTTSTSTTSTSTTSTTVPTGLTTVCPILRTLAAAFPFLAPILGNVAVALGCPVTG